VVVLAAEELDKLLPILPLELLDPPLLPVEELVEDDEEDDEEDEVDEEEDDDENAEELEPDVRRAVLGIEMVVEDATLEDEKPPRVPRNWGATKEAKFCADVVPVSRTVRSSVPRKTFAVRTWTGCAAPAWVARAARRVCTA
jgi:hypothetical protein